MSLALIELLYGWGRVRDKLETIGEPKLDSLYNISFSSSHCLTLSCSAMFLFPGQSELKLAFGRALGFFL